jgi:hypothetical protein
VDSSFLAGWSYVFVIFVCMNDCCEVSTDECWSYICGGGIAQVYKGVVEVIGGQQRPGRLVVCICNICVQEWLLWSESRSIWEC